MKEYNNNKSAWLFSTESWGIQRLSKHYYALELCNYVDEVYFFNPFSYSNRATILIDQSKDNKKLKIVSCGFFKKGKRFLPFWLTNLLFNSRIRWIQYKLGHKPDIVFSFDHNDIISFRPFGAKFNFFLLYDLILDQKFYPRIAESADLLVTITPTIEKVLKKFNKPILLIQHGLNMHFEENAKQQLFFNNSFEINKPVLNAIFIGSLFKASLDRTSFKIIIETNPKIKFHFFGSYGQNNNNLGGNLNKDICLFIDFLKGTENVILHGSQLASVIVCRLSIMDFCLHMEINSNQNRDISNAHKINEYLSTGKPIFSTLLDSQLGLENLIFISRNSTVEDFKIFITKLPLLSLKINTDARIKYALQHTYKKNIDKILNSL